MAESHFKLLLIFFILVFVPIIITILTAYIVLRLERNNLVYKIARDVSQVIYLLVTFLGLTGYETGIRFIRNRLSLDVVCVVFLSSSCFIMSLTSLQKILPNGLLIVLEIISNTSASVYIGMLYARYGDYR